MWRKWWMARRFELILKRSLAQGKGFVDFIFYPRRKSLPGIVLELNADKTPADAIAQIREKEYCEKLRKENVTRILAVGINYDTKKKEHQCVIEELGWFFPAYSPFLQIE